MTFWKLVVASTVVNSCIEKYIAFERNHIARDWLGNARQPCWRVSHDVSGWLVVHLRDELVERTFEVHTKRQHITDFIGNQVS
jgi:uncharacterized membrane protein YjdF